MLDYDRPGNIVWDIRSHDEFTGINNRGNRRSGHVPGAIHLEWTELINDDDHSFKDLDVLRNLLSAKGITPDKAIHIYWQGGIRAAHGAFVLALLGFPKVCMYDGSMGEWANRIDTPLTIS